ncbi:TRAP transporter small permease subunit [Marinobacter sp. M1N3S26]|uniref:TRAP transporter small permease subunit n=1 Tax=Marinobacter sp. M1N3S26 TaxID=3382299 RepID=UPI00387B0E85
MTEPATFSAPASPAAHHNGLPHNRLSQGLDRLISAIGRGLSWLWLVMLVVVLVNVFSRFVLSRGSIALEELSWHLFGIAMMMTLAYAVVKDDHVRVDVLREKFSLRTRALIEALGIALLALPILYLMMEALVPYAWKAFVLDERSQAPSGLPYRFIFKGFLPLGLALVALALFSRLTRCTTLLAGFPRALAAPHDQEEDH